MSLKISTSKKRASLKLLACTGLLSIVSGCADRPPETFPKPDYSYLPKMNLNVARIDVSDEAIPKKENSLASKSPTPPDQTLTLMANQRLNATGNSGTGIFTITEANIEKSSDDILIGHMNVSLTLDDPTHNRHAEVTAQVTHQDNLSGNNSKRHELYELNQHLMDDMNVELEYQIRKNMGDWLTDATGAPLNAAIKSQNLDNMDAKFSAQAEDDPTGRTTPPSTTNSLTTENSNTPAQGASATTQQPHSPPEGVLHLP